MAKGQLITMIPLGATIVSDGIQYRLMRRYKTKPGTVGVEVKSLVTGIHAMNGISDTERFEVIDS